MFIGVFGISAAASVGALGLFGGISVPVDPFLYPATIFASYAVIPICGLMSLDYLYLGEKKEIWPGTNVIDADKKIYSYTTSSREDYMNGVMCMSCYGVSASPLIYLSVAVNPAIVPTAAALTAISFMGALTLCYPHRGDKLMALFATTVTTVCCSYWLLTHQIPITILLSLYPVSYVYFEMRFLLRSYHCAELWPVSYGKTLADVGIIIFTSCVFGLSMLYLPI